MASLSFTTVAGGLLAAWLINQLGRAIYNYFFHPLAAFPGPQIVATAWFKTYQEIVLSRNWIDVLHELHEKYGPVVRVGPNEFHFSDPAAHHEIYNNANRWDKQATLYHSFGEDTSSFGFLTYLEAKQRKDVLAPLFSKRAISDVQGLIWQHMDRLCDALAARGAAGESSDMLFALRCFTLDAIMGYCFAKDVHATGAKDYRAPIVVAMDASLPAFTIFRHFDLVRRMVFSFPGWFTRLTNPALAGLVDLQELLGAQVTEVLQNPLSLQETSHPIIYHRLLDPEANKAIGGPSAVSLYEEAQALMFGGAESSGNVAMLGTFHVLQNPAVLQRLKTELRQAWPDVQARPSLEDLEKLPFLTAVIKESLRMSPSVPAPLLRMTPAAGATVSGEEIPPGTIVGMSLTFVHSSATIFEDPARFDPGRWQAPDSAALEKYLLPFSKGPRSCLGQTLALCELYVAFASLFRRFDVELDGTKAEDLSWRECFLPAFNTRHMKAYCRLVKS